MTKKQLTNKMVKLMGEGMTSGEAIESIKKEDRIKKLEAIISDPNTEWTDERESAEEALFHLTMEV